MRSIMKFREMLGKRILFLDGGMGNSIFLEGDTIVAVTSRRGSLRQINDIFA